MKKLVHSNIKLASDKRLFKGISSIHLYTLQTIFIQLGFSNRPSRDLEDVGNEFIEQTQTAQSEEPAKKVLQIETHKQ
jgi:hypothetical protein